MCEQTLFDNKDNGLYPCSNSNPEKSIKCYKCDKIFHNHNQLSIHTLKEHIPPLLIQPHERNPEDEQTNPLVVFQPQTSVVFLKDGKLPVLNNALAYPTLDQTLQSYSLKSTEEMFLLDGKSFDPTSVKGAENLFLLNEKTSIRLCATKATSSNEQDNPSFNIQPSGRLPSKGSEKLSPNDGYCSLNTNPANPSGYNNSRIKHVKEADKLFLKDGKTSSENLSYLLSILPPDLIEHAETVFPLDGKLSIHLTDFQFLQQNEMIPLGVDEEDGDIPQLDGNDTSDDDSNEEMSIVGLTENEIYARDPALILSGYSFEDINPIKATTATTKMSNFALNKEKQMENLAGDAKLSDFKKKINDDDKNVSIQCSAAFYDAVAKPVLCGLNQGTILTVGNIPIHCNHIDHNRDSSGYEYNRVLHIILGGGAQPNIGKVTVHLHHTKRHVQMQGSAKMPDGNFAPVWFLNSFIKDRFVSLAKLKHYDITAINKMVKAIFENTKESVRAGKNCCQCSRQFSSNSRPTKCIYCNQLFHKTNCLPAQLHHLCFLLFQLLPPHPDQCRHHYSKTPLNHTHHPLKTIQKEKDFSRQHFPLLLSNLLSHPQALQMTQMMFLPHN